MHGKSTSSWKTFGIPLVARLTDSICGSDIHNLYLKLLGPFELSTDEAMEDLDSSKDIESEDTVQKDDTVITDMDGSGDPIIVDEVTSSSDHTFRFYLADEKGTIRESEIVMTEPFLVTGMSKRFNMLVCWPEKSIEQYDTCLLSSLPEVFKFVLFAKRPQESVSLYKCLEAFLKEEPLGPEDMW